MYFYSCFLWELSDILTNQCRHQPELPNNGNITFYRALGTTYTPPPFPSLYVLYIVMGAYKYLHCLPSPADANVTVSVASVCYKKRGWLCDLLHSEKRML